MNRMNRREKDSLIMTIRKLPTEFAQHYNINIDDYKQEGKYNTYEDWKRNVCPDVDVNTIRPSQLHHFGCTFDESGDMILNDAPHTVSIINTLGKIIKIISPL